MKGKAVVVGGKYFQKVYTHTQKNNVKNKKNYIWLTIVALLLLSLLFFSLFSVLSKFNKCPGFKPKLYAPNNHMPHIGTFSNPIVMTKFGNASISEDWLLFVGPTNKTRNRLNAHNTTYRTAQNIPA